MPLLTVALVVHGEQAWIHEFAESVLGQEPADVELLAIDDASPDHAPEILDELAARDAGVQVKTLYSDALDDDVKTYADLMRHNVNSLVEGLR